MNGVASKSVSTFPQVTKRAIRAINPNNDRPLHVSFDIDALDPAESPATGTPGIKHKRLWKAPPFPIRLK